MTDYRVWTAFPPPILGSEGADWAEVETPVTQQSLRAEQRRPCGGYGHRTADFPWKSDDLKWFDPPGRICDEGGSTRPDTLLLNRVIDGEAKEGPCLSLWFVLRLADGQLQRLQEPRAVALGERRGTAGDAIGAQVCHQLTCGEGISNVVVGEGLA